MVTEKAKAFMEGGRCAKIYDILLRNVINTQEINDCFKDYKKQSGYSLPDYEITIENLKKEFDELYLIIEKLEGSNLGGLSEQTKESCNNFENAHKELCYKVASLKPWG